MGRDGPLCEVAMVSVATKERAYELIDQMGPSQVSAAVELLERFVHPVSLAELNALPEDELISEEEKRIALETRGRGYAPSATSHEELLAEFGLTVDSWKEMDLEPADAQTSRR